ncbi:hypothetical protein ACFY74_11890 [Streptomyces massasporeus]|uniref:hypothetical protein n=1 Tax=Streptomyces massasporeus TaxID=67324 RepID=UPI0036B8EFAB
MSKSTGPACGNNPNYRMSDGDRQAVEDFRAYLAARAALRNRIAEALEQADYRPDMRRGDLADAVLPVLPAPVDRAAVLREVEAALRARGKRLTGEYNDSDILHEDGPAAAAATWKRAAELVGRMADEAQPTQPQPTPCSTPNPCEDGELCATHEEQQAHAAGEHDACGITCEVQMPTAPMRNSIVAHGIPGTAGMLDELLRRAAAGLLPAVEEPGPDVVAFRSPDKPAALWCRKHGARWWGLAPLTSDDLPDGGVCGDCGVDVLIQQEGRS